MSQDVVTVITPVNSADDAHCQGNSTLVGFIQVLYNASEIGTECRAC